MTYTGRVWKFGDNISTDIIMPNTVVFNKLDISFQEASQHTMQAICPG